MAHRHSSSQMNQIFNYNSNQDNQQPGQVTSPTTKAYYSHSHASPYVGGKKNTGFAHPSFVSNQVFYNRDTKNKSSNPRQDYEEPRNQREERNEPAGNRYRDDREDNYGDNDRYRSRGETRGNQDYDNRDDRSEASALSSTNYICPNCLNRHLCDDQRNQCRKQREEDIEKERRITDYNKRVSKEEEAQQRFNRSRRVDEGHDLRDKLDREYNEKLEYRRSPRKDGSGSGFQTMFERQEELVQKQKNMNQAFGSSLQDQIRHDNHQRYLEKERNSSPYGTSLQIGEGYHNRYLRSSDLASELKEQAEDRAYQQRKDRELEKRFAQEKTEQELRANEEEERRRKEREWKQKRDYKNDLLRTIEGNKNKQREEFASRQSERSALDQGYADYKRRQAEEEEKAKKQLFEYGQNLKNQQDHSSCRQQYEERRQQRGERTSFDPTSKSKKMYPCGDCHVPYEKAYLTKYE